jgi:hypothetical protein
MLVAIGRLVRCERGNIVTMFAVLLPCLLGIAGLAIETGYWFTERHKLQMAADTAAYSALVAYSINRNTADAVTMGVEQAVASGYSGPAGTASVQIPSPEGALGPNSSMASLRQQVPLFLSRLFLNSASIEIGVVSYAMFDPVANPPCMLSLKNQSRSLLVAASVRMNMKCVVASNATAADAIWLEGTTSLTANCIATPGSAATNGGASITLTTCDRANHSRDVSADPFAGTPFWGSAMVPDRPGYADQHVSQGRYGKGMPGGNQLQPGKYGKQVEIDGEVHLAPGVYYFTNGFRAAPNSRITGEGVTLMFNQSRVLDVAQNVAWSISAPESGATKGIAMMGDPAITTAGNVRLIGVLGNVKGAVYFPHQTLLTESGPNRASSVCTQVVAATIDVRGAGTIVNDCSGGGGASGGRPRVRLVRGPGS